MQTKFNFSKTKIREAVLIESFIAWVGGKRFLRKHIISLFPINFERYIEVFGGAGWVLFGKDKHASLEVFNDIDSNLINLYRCIKYHQQELERELNNILISREQFFNFKNQLQISGFTDIQRAARYFYIIKLSFGCKRDSFNTSCRRGIFKSIERFKEIQERLQNVNIENKDFENLIKIYDRPKALFYLDPPYFGVEKFYKTSNNGATENYFSKEDHIRLFETIKAIKGKFILSYNSNDFIKGMYKDYNISNIERLNSMSIKNKKTNYKEIIITNY